MSVLFAIENSETSGLSWFLAGEDGVAEAVDEALLGKVNAQDTVLVVSGRDVQMSHVDVVARGEKELLAAALFQLEDDLAEPVSDVHLALGQKDGASPNRRKVAVVSDRKMDEWLETLDGAGIPNRSAIRIVPDTSLIDGVNDGALLFDGDGVVLFTTGRQEYAVDAELAEQIIPAIIQDEELSDVAYIEGPTPRLTAELHGATLNRQGLKTYPDFIASRLTPGAGLNLRQGEYRVESNLDLGFISRWKATLVLAGVALIAWFGFLVVSAYRLDQETNRLRESAVQAWQAVYPNDAQIRDPHAATMARLAEIGASADAGTGVTGILSAFYKGLEKVEGAELIDISYKRETGRLSVKLKFTGYQDRDALKKTLEAIGFSVDLRGVTQEDGFLVGQAILEAQS